jgi:tetratricopeptide (TPR) repeat protein
MPNVMSARAILFIVALVGCLGAPTKSFAQWHYDAKQLPLLPPYCKYTQLYRAAVPGANNPAEIERWRAIMGGEENFSHLHHYCWALENTNRGLYSERTKLERDRRLAESLGDFDYVIRSVKPDFVLLPEILTKKGENLIRLERGAEALQDLLRAIELKPDYWPSYAAISDHFKQLGDTATARSWVEKGLTMSPDANALKRRLNELDGIKSQRR